MAVGVGRRGGPIAPVGIAPADDQCGGGMAEPAPGVLQEMRLVVAIVVPVLLQLGLMQFVNRATLAFVGHYDPEPEKIASAALGSMYASITGLSLGIGITLAAGSYCAQNFGRGATMENGVVVRHCLSAHVLCFVFALFMAEVSPALLGAFGQPSELLQPVRQFSLISAFAWPGNWIFTCLNTVLSSQNWQVVGLAGQALSSTINFALSWLLLSHGVGFLGIAVANVIGAWASVAYIVAHIVARRLQCSVWLVPSVVSAAGQLTLGQYLRSAIPMAASMWVEWWAVEVMAIFAGWLPGRQTSLAAHGILFNTLAVVYMAFVAVSRACMFRVGHQVGARNVPGVRRSIGVCVAVSASLSCAVAALLNAFGGRLTELYTRNPRILAAANPAMVGVVLSVPPYSVTMCLMGAMRSAGLQLWGAKALFVSYYAVGLPIGYCLGVVEQVGLLGIWLGNVAALSCAALLSLAKIARVDWALVVERAAHDAERESPTPMAAMASYVSESPLLWREASVHRRPSIEHSGFATSCCVCASEDTGAHADTSQRHSDMAQRHSEFC